MTPQKAENDIAANGIEGEWRDSVADARTAAIVGCFVAARVGCFVAARDTVQGLSCLGA